MPRNRRIPEDTADYARWLADRIEERGERLPFRINPATAMFVGMALRGYARLLDGREAAGMVFTVSHVGEGRADLLAACKAPEIAWAAYHLAIAATPQQAVVLRHGDRIIGRHPPRVASTAVSNLIGPTVPPPQDKIARENDG